jgi:hypothetical protein
MTLTLTLGSRTVILPRRGFLPGLEGYDRREIRIDGGDATGEIAYSAAGTPILDGPAVPNKHRWQISAYVTEELYYGLAALYADHADRQRRFVANWQIGLADEKARVVDFGARTRAIVGGTTEQAVPGGGVAYFAVFQVALGVPKGEPVNNPQYPWLVRFGLSELEVVSP